MDRVLQQYKMAGVPEFQEEFRKRQDDKNQLRFFVQALNLLED